MYNTLVLLVRSCEGYVLLHAHVCMFRLNWLWKPDWFPCRSGDSCVVSPHLFQKQELCTSYFVEKAHTIRLSLRPCLFAAPFFFSFPHFCVLKPVGKERVIASNMISALFQSALTSDRHFTALCSQRCPSHTLAASDLYFTVAYAMLAWCPSLTPPP